MQRNLSCVAFSSKVKKTVIKSILCTSLCCSPTVLPNQGKQKNKMWTWLTTLNAQLKWTCLYSFLFLITGNPSQPVFPRAQYEQASRRNPWVQTSRQPTAGRARSVCCHTVTWCNAGGGGGGEKKAIKKVRPSRRNRRARWHRSVLPSAQNKPSCR